MMKRPRVALVNLITQTPLVRTKAPKVRSNKEAMIIAFARILKKRGMNVDVFVSDAYQPQKQEEVGVNVIYLPTKLKSVFWPSSIPFTPRLIKDLKNNYDIVVCSEIFQVATVLAVVSKFLSKEKMEIVVWQEMSKHQRLGGKFISKFYHSVIVRYLLDKHISCYIPRGEMARDFLLNQRIHPEKIKEIVPHGIDSKRFFPDINVSKERYIFSPSRLVETKGIDVLLKAFAKVSSRIQDLKLVIQGYGPDLNDYKKMAKVLGIDKEVVFSTKRVDHHQMRRKYQQALITVIASRRDLIIFSAFESIACGTPIIISDGVDTHRNFVNHQGGAVFPCGDVDSLATLITKFVEDEYYRIDMERAALLKAKRFYNEYLAKQFARMIV